MSARLAPAAALAFLRDLARAEGFEGLGVSDARAQGPEGERLRAFLDAGRHGSMDWMASTAERRAAPTALWAGAVSAIMLAANYGPEHDPLPALARRERGYVAVYARGRDYHELLKGRLKRIAQRFAVRQSAEVKVFVDTAPLMEKPLAARAGLGWQGRHTNLVSRDWGNWLFLGAILTDAPLPFDAPARDHCGSCRQCLDACPTGAFPAPYQLDARRCIAYLTIEHHGPIPREFRPAIGNRIFGCDDCLAVCPWNKFASRAAETRFHGREAGDGDDLDALWALSDADFRAHYQGGPVRRLGYERFRRNVMIALGNSGRGQWADLAVAALDEESALVRGTAIWALSRLDKARFLAEKSRRAAAETDPEARQEWSATPI